MYIAMDSFLKNWSAQIKKGYLDLCILAIIQKHDQVYGFQLLSALQNLEIPVKEGTLYPLLNRMTKEGALSARWHTEGVSGHPRKYYSLTAAGASAMVDMKLNYEKLFDVYQKIIEGDHNDRPKTRAVLKST